MKAPNSAPKDVISNKLVYIIMSSGFRYKVAKIRPK